MYLRPKKLSHTALLILVLYVFQDGSCNGLQHYAALGRDEKGGQMVNLTPSLQRQDVYQGVAQAVRVSFV